MDIKSDLAPTGILRVSINLGNPVLAQGSATAPSGVTVDIARELGVRLGLPIELRCFEAARESFEAMEQGQCDICFLAVDPAREAVIAFTAPYAVIEGVFAVPEKSSITCLQDIDRPSIRVGVKEGSAYDLYLSRTLEHAVVVRGKEGVTVFLSETLEVAAGIRQPIERFVAEHRGIRLVEPRFMEIRQALATTRSRGDETVAYLRAFIEELKGNGFIAEALRRAGRKDATVAPPAD